MKNSLLVLMAFGLILFSCKKDKVATTATVTDVDGNVYKTIKIGNQVWMAENLKVIHYNTGTKPEDKIPLVENGGNWANLAEPGYCYYNNSVDNKIKYGALYNWYAVSTGKLAPKGWHVATQADWEELRSFLITNGYNYDGSKDVDKIAKSLAATSGWENYQELGTVGNDQKTNNKSGFSALPGGLRNPDGSYDSMNYTSSWWSTEKVPVQDLAKIWSVDYFNYNLVGGGVAAPLKAGLSVRCVKDTPIP